MQQTINLFEKPSTYLKLNTNQIIEIHLYLLILYNNKREFRLIVLFA